MNELEQAFNELFYGSGFLLGFVIMLSICILVSYKIKYSSIIFEVVLLFQAIEYSQNLPSDSYKMWGVILCLVTMFFIAWKFATDLRE